LGLSELGLQVEPPTDDWRRPRPNIAALRMDIVAGIALAVGSIVTLPLYMWAGITPANDLPDWLALLWSVAVTLPIGWRRRAPVRIAVAVSAVFIAGGIAFGSGLFFPTIALFVVIYTVGAWVDDRRLARWARLGIIAAMGLWIVGAIFYYSTSPAHNQDPVRGGPFSPLVAGTLINISINAVFFAGAYYFGERGYASAITHDTLLRRNAELDAERAKSADQAVALDRTRIARDLHDVVGHHVSVMGVQASAARVALDKDPQLAQTSLSEVENNARTAIEELHGLLTTLRAAEPDNNTPATGGSNPRARVDDLTSLTRQMSSSGVPTRLEIIGSPVQLGDVLSLNLYRITQEALTNVGKHAGTTATADVRLRYLGDEVELEIRNSGAMVSRRSPSGGLGQLGMRERVAACQGSIELGPLQRGGYLVRARMPIHAQNQQLAGPEPGRSDGPS
jgi:signal transduction histidine kinase